MMDFKRWFTLVEMIIVLLIIWLISWALWKMFTYKDVTRAKYGTCYLHIDSNITSFFEYWLLQKQVYSWDKYEKVKNYQVVFNVNTQKVSLIYSWTDQKKIYVLSWDFVDNLNDCHGKQYHTLLSWENLKVVINPWLNPDQGKQDWIWMTLYTWNDFIKKLPAWATWAVYFYYCPGAWTKWCLERNKIEVDTRTALFKSYFCEDVDINNWKCIKWSK